MTPTQRSEIARFRYRSLDGGWSEVSLCRATRIRVFPRNAVMERKIFSTDNKLSTLWIFWAEQFFYRFLDFVFSEISFCHLSSKQTPALAFYLNIFRLIIRTEMNIISWCRHQRLLRKLLKVMLHETNRNNPVLEQHSITTLLRHCFECFQHCSNIASLCCAKHRSCKSFRVTSPLGSSSFSSSDSTLASRSPFVCLLLFFYLYVVRGLVFRLHKHSKASSIGVSCVFFKISYVCENNLTWIINNYYSKLT